MKSDNDPAKGRQKPVVVTVFGSSRLRPEEPAYREAVELGSLLAAGGYTLCNGGYGGSMEASAKGAAGRGGTAIGVLTKAFRTTPNPFMTGTVLTSTYLERLLKLVELGEAYIVLKGGTGTLLELAYVWEGLNKGVLETKPIIVLGEFWSQLVTALNDELIGEGLPGAARHIAFARTPRECLDLLDARFRRA